MLKIRLRRMGSKKRPFYRVVVSDSRNTPRGPFVDVVGTYDPAQQPATVELDLAKIEEWVGKGAQPSDTVSSLVRQARAAAAAAPAAS